MSGLPFRLTTDEFTSSHVQCTDCGCLLCCGQRCGCAYDSQFTPQVRQQLQAPQPQTVSTAVGGFR